VDASDAPARVALPFALATLIWGSTWLVIEYQLPYAPAAWSITWRFLLAAGSMLAAAWWTGKPLRLGAAGQRLALLVGVSQFTLNYLLVYAAEARIASGLVALVSALMILPNALFAAVFLHHRVSSRFVAGSAIAIGGITVLFAQELVHAALPPGRILAGVGLAVAGLLAASVGNVLQATRDARAVAPATLLAWAMGYGAVGDAAVAWVQDGPPAFSLAPAYLAGLVYLAVAGSAVSFSCYYHVIRQVGPARAAWVGVLIPVIAMALSTLFEGYRWSVAAGVGAALAVAGLALAIRARSPSR
jgi:drug/metabolite transporter (DMT)-like permease